MMNFELANHAVHWSVRSWWIVVNGADGFASLTMALGMAKNG